MSILELRRPSPTSEDVQDPTEATIKQKASEWSRSGWHRQPTPDRLAARAHPAAPRHRKTRRAVSRRGVQARRGPDGSARWHGKIDGGAREDGRETKRMKERQMEWVIMQLICWAQSG